ncbi:MAG: acyl-CoA carboxylase subunit epsilon [Mycobacterium sp.]|nr:acyl-CoA carboxylase subunit epsilon [Mycobacterium sp.]
MTDQNRSDTNGAVHQHVDIHIERGRPTDEEIAALVTVLGGAAGGAPSPQVAERNMWGHPVGNLRYSVFSWQRVTLLERTYMRR